MKVIYIILLTALIFNCSRASEQNEINKRKSRTEETVKPENKKERSLQIIKSFQNETKYGITYTIPKNWKKISDDFKAIDLKGEIKSIQTDYIDESDKSNISIIYHPGDNGKKIYDFKIKTFDDNSQYITISGKKVIKKIEKLNFDGKGHAINPPKNKTTISILSTKGEIEIILNSNSYTAENTFDKFISTIKIEE